jgi:hypothetical protein
MNIQQTVPDMCIAFRNWLRRRWRAQLVDLNVRIAQLECVRDEARPVRMTPSEADRHLLAVRSLAVLVRQRKGLAKRLNMEESRAACIKK